MSRTKTDLIASLDAFTIACLECALWSSTDGSTESGGEPLDANYTIDDMTVDAIRSLQRDCRSFTAHHGQDIDRAGLTLQQAGHDFWLTRNGHGTGFWDRGLGEIGERLSKASKAYGSCDLQVYRGKVHAS
jgi:hypothetical protein